MRRRRYPSRNVTQDTVFTPETAQAKAEAAIWLTRLLETPIPLDDNFFAFLGWCVGGLKPLARYVQTNAVLLGGRKAEVLKAKKAAVELGDISEKRLGDALLVEHVLFMFVHAVYLKIVNCNVQSNMAH